MLYRMSSNLLTGSGTKIIGKYWRKAGCRESISFGITLTLLFYHCTLENILYRVGCLWKIKAGFAMEELEASEIVSRVAAEGEVPNFKHFCFPAFSSPTRGLVNRSTRWKWWWKRWCPLFFYRLKSDSRVRSFIELARLRLLTTPLIVQPNPFNVTSGGQKYCHFSHFSFSVNITFFNCHQLRCHNRT